VSAAPSIHPAVQAALGRKQKAIRWSLVIGAAAVLTLFVLVILVWQAGIGVLPLAIVLAFFPLPFYLAYSLWIDRYEPEPRWLLLIVFLWGALVSTPLAFILNSVGSWIVGENLGGDAAEVYGASISAPVVEEGAKAAVLLLIFWRWRRLFNGPLDGAVYAILVGLGFTVTEDALYYARGAAEDGVDGALFTFVVRGLLSPFGHPLYTAMFGIGLGLAARTTKQWVKIAAPIAGFALAVGLHSLWNSAGDLIVVLYVLLFIPLLIAMAVLGLFAMRREGRVVRKYLPPDVIPPEEARRLYSLRTRLADSFAALRTGGIRGFRDREDYIRAVSEVAFERYREARGIGRPASAPSAPASSR
jgi:RsiW-degrading membrane proteinase PrsW (M82 family)